MRSVTIAIMSYISQPNFLQTPLISMLMRYKYELQISYLCYCIDITYTYVNTLMRFKYAKLTNTIESQVTPFLTYVMNVLRITHVTILT